MYSKVRPLFIFILPLIVVMSSCLKRDLEELEKQVADLEKVLGTNEPMVVEFTTTNLDNVAVEKKTSFGFKSLYHWSNYLQDNQDGTFEIYIERFGDVDWNEGAWVYFEYDEATETFSNEEAGVYFRDQFRNYVNPTFDPDYSGHTFELKINSINTSTGQVSVSINASTDNTAANNEYPGKPMTFSLAFNGKLPIFID